MLYSFATRSTVGRLSTTYLPGCKKYRTSVTLTWWYSWLGTNRIWSRKEKSLASQRWNSSAKTTSNTGQRHLPRRVITLKRSSLMLQSSSTSNYKMQRRPRRAAQQATTAPAPTWDRSQEMPHLTTWQNLGLTPTNTTTSSLSQKIWTSLKLSKKMVASAEEHLTKQLLKRID